MSCVTLFLCDVYDSESSMQTLISLMLSIIATCQLVNMSTHAYPKWCISEHICCLHEESQASDMQTCPNCYLVFLLEVVYFLHHSIIILHLLPFQKHLGFDSVQGFSVCSYLEGLKIQKQKDAIKLGSTKQDDPQVRLLSQAKGESSLWVAGLATNAQRSSYITDSL